MLFILGFLPCSSHFLAVLNVVFIRSPSLICALELINYCQISWGGEIWAPNLRSSSSHFLSIRLLKIIPHLPELAVMKGHEP